MATRGRGLNMGWELVIAMLLDAVFGEPRMLWDRLPHPAVLMGRLVAFLDHTLNTGQDRKSKGVLSTLSAMLYRRCHRQSAKPIWMGH